MTGKFAETYIRKLVQFCDKITISITGCILIYTEDKLITFVTILKVLQK